MNRIKKLFNQSDKKITSIYFCAGHPHRDGTVGTIQALEQAGVDMVEIGIPFSDPMADGPVIQHAATQALANGMSLKLLFEQLQGIRSRVSLPLILMGYLNPILQYGFERFCRSCRDCGIDGIIIPDLPFREFQEQYRSIAEQFGVSVIMLITPETNEQRIRQIDSATDAFIYMVSSAAITGEQKEFDEARRAYFRRVESLALRNPCLVGFGISNRRTYDAATAHARGAIIGSRFVRLLDENHGDAAIAISQLLEDLRS